MTQGIINRLRADDRGATSIEYGIIAMLIAIALIGTILSMGDTVQGHYETVGTEYSEAANKARN